MGIGRISENILEDILGRVDIVEVISGCIPLKRAGRNFRATCPFHHEKTPSFMVSPDRQIYHCFGCGAGGNAFNFLMQYERLEFPEAVEILAKKSGVILPQTAGHDEKIISLTTQLYKINELAALFYQNILNSAAGNHAKSYLLKRGLKEETIKAFKLGLAPDKWDGLINYLRAKSVSLSFLEKAGLVLTKDGGGYYDRFRNRLIFPIADIKARILGFGARVLDETLPKYVNSPETPIYTKGKNLYGFNFAKDTIRDEDSVVIVEGYLDFILPYQEGFKNILASLGTALTLEQVRFIKRYTSNVVMVYDPDKAGELATLRTLDIFIEEGINVKVVSLPEGLDPDLFVRKNGIEEFKTSILQAESLFDYKLKILKKRYNAREIEGKAKISSEMLATITKFKNEVLKSEYLKRLAEELSIREESLWQELAKIKEPKLSSNFNQPLAKKLPLSINPTEKLLIKLMLQEADLINRVKDNLEPADFRDERVSGIVSAMFELIDQGKEIEPNKLMNCIESDEALQIIRESTFMPEISEGDKEKIIDDCIRRLKSERLKFKREQLHDEIKAAQVMGDDEKLNRLMQQFHDLIKKR